MSEQEMHGIDEVCSECTIDEPCRFIRDVPVRVRPMFADHIIAERDRLSTALRAMARRSAARNKLFHANVRALEGLSADFAALRAALFLPDTASRAEMVQEAEELVRINDDVVGELNMISETLVRRGYKVNFKENDSLDHWVREALDKARGKKLKRSWFR